MPLFASFAIDAVAFILVPWLVWRLLRRSVPLAVLPILLGLLLAVAGWGDTEWSAPSPLGNQIGFIGVLLLAFTAGLEMRHTPEGDAALHPPVHIHSSLTRLALSAGNALAMPFIVGTVAAYVYFNQLPGWDSPRGEGWTSAMAIGLCLAVSALPVLIGIVRELRPAHRPLGQLALGVAVIDDAVLWVGLALLLVFANGSQGMAGWGMSELLALGLLGGLAAAGVLLQRQSDTLRQWHIWLLSLLFLAVGAWSSYKLGLHALLGAYFAGAVFPPKWIRRLPVERVGRFALFGLAPLFFGHSGLGIDGNALNLTSLLAAGALLLLSMSTKIGAIAMLPPSSSLSRRETLAVGTLLQCKGLMEIVAATILRDQGLLSEPAYAALVTLAILSTTLTGPLFRLCFRRTPQDQAEDMVSCPCPRSER